MGEDEKTEVKNIDDCVGLNNGKDLDERVKNIVVCDVTGQIYMDAIMIKPCGKTYPIGILVECPRENYDACRYLEDSKEK